MRICSSPARVCGSAPGPGWKRRSRGFTGPVRVRSSSGRTRSPVASVITTGGTSAEAIFIGVDAIGGFVLTPLARLGPSEGSTFEGFKRLFDVLLLLGTLAFGTGALFALSRSLGRRLERVGLGIGGVSILAALACLGELPLGKVVGLCIAAGAVLFVAVGLQLARPSAYARAGVGL